jgi:hypothetical protein
VAIETSEPACFAISDIQWSLIALTQPFPSDSSVSFSWQKGCTAKHGQCLLLVASQRSLLEGLCGGVKRCGFGVGITLHMTILLTKHRNHSVSSGIPKSTAYNCDLFDIYIGYCSKIESVSFQYPADE